MTVEVEYADALSYNRNDLYLEIRLPNSSGTLVSDSCLSGMSDRAVYDACRSYRLSDSHVTLAVSNLGEFCSKSDLICKVRLDDYVNSWYATDEEDAVRDSFTFEMFYVDTDGVKMPVYEGSNEPTYARPMLEPLDIELVSVEFDPLV